MAEQSPEKTGLVLWWRWEKARDEIGIGPAKFRELCFVAIRPGSFGIGPLDGLTLSPLGCIHPFPEELGHLGGVGILRRRSVWRPLGDLEFAPPPRFPEDPDELGNIDITLGITNEGLRLGKLAVLKLSLNGSLVIAKAFGRFLEGYGISCVVRHTATLLWGRGKMSSDTSPTFSWILFI